MCKFYISSKHFEENSNLTYLKQLVSFTISPKHLKENHCKAFPLHTMIPNKHDAGNSVITIHCSKTKLKILWGQYMRQLPKFALHLILKQNT